MPPSRHWDTDALQSRPPRASRRTRLGGVSRCPPTRKPMQGILQRSLSPKPWHMSSLKASWVAGHVRSAATYMAHVCACGLGGELLRCVWNTSGTGLERGLERLREWLALWNASKPHVNMVVSTENGIEPLPYRIESGGIASHRTEPKFRNTDTPFFISFSFFLAPLLLLSCSTPFQPWPLHLHTRQRTTI